MEYVLSNGRNGAFGAQRKLGRCSENPDFKQKLNIDNTLRTQCEVTSSSGNT